MAFDPARSRASRALALLPLVLALAGCAAPAAPAAPPLPPAPPPPAAGAPNPEPRAAGSLDLDAARRLAGRVAIVAECPEAVDLALRALLRGGTAADAAIAGLLGAGVAQPVSSGLGGGGMALYWDASARRATVLDFVETAPAGLRHWEHRRRHPPEERRGLGVGVPGELAGLAELQRRWGKLPLADPLEAAAELAERGFVVAYHLARSARWMAPWLAEEPVLGPVLAPGGQPIEPRSQARNPALAATLRRIATEGDRVFYEGALAEDVVATARAAGSTLSLADLRAYRVIERAPLEGEYEGYRVITLPPPSSGGVLVLQALGMHPAASLRALGHGSGAYAHVLAETFRASTVDRVRSLGDPDRVPVDVAPLLDPARLAARRVAIDPLATRAPVGTGVDDPGTAHIIVVDAEGNVASVTSSVGDLFGARLVTAAGFPLNDHLTQFTPRVEAAPFGVPRSSNAPRRRARPLSHAAATLVVRDGAPRAALGGSGGAFIGSAVTQALLAHLVFGQPAPASVAARRVRAPQGGGALVEPGEDAALVEDLRRRGELVRASPDYSAVAMVVWRATAAPAHRLEAAADARKGGVALVP